jgi:hypothetical protein
MNIHPFAHRKNRRSLAAMVLRVIEASIALGALWVTLFIGSGSTIAAFATVIDAAIFSFWLGLDAASLHNRFCGMSLPWNRATYALSGDIRSENIRDFASMLEIARRKAHLCTTQSVGSLHQSFTSKQVADHIPVHELANIWLSKTGEIDVIRRRTRMAQPELVPAVLALFVEPGASYSVTYRGVRRTWLIYGPNDIRERIENVRWCRFSVGLRFHRRQWRWLWFVEQHGPNTEQTICSLLFFELRWIYPVESLKALLEARARYEHNWNEEDRASLALSRLNIAVTRNLDTYPVWPASRKYMLRRGKEVCLMVEYHWRSITITKIYV